MKHLCNIFSKRSQLTITLHLQNKKRLSYTLDNVDNCPFKYNNIRRDKSNKKR